MSVIVELIEREQPEHLQEYFHERVAHYRQANLELNTQLYMALVSAIWRRRLLE